MKVEEAIKTALEYETKVRDVYRDAKDKISDPKGREIFRLLAEEEQGHVDYLQSKLYQWQRTGAVTAESLDTAIPPRDKIDEGVDRLHDRIADVDQDNDLQMLRKALDVELETKSFYKTVIHLLPPDDQKLFTNFLSIEEGHVAIVQAEIDHLTQNGYWFDFMEIDLND